MKERAVTAIERGQRSSTLRLECGHDRSIGGHVFPDGRLVPNAAHPLWWPMTYSCYDGHCGGWK